MLTKHIQDFLPLYFKNVLFRPTNMEFGYNSTPPVHFLGNNLEYKIKAGCQPVKKQKYKQ